MWKVEAHGKFGGISGGKAYWISGGGEIERGNLDRRGDLDRSTIETLIAGVRPGPMAIDGGKMYWASVVYTEDAPGKIERANLDGSGRETLIELTHTGRYGKFIRGMAIFDGKMYWTVRDGELIFDIDDAQGRIERANLNGSGRETLVTGIDMGSTGGAIAIAGDHEKMYWSARSILVDSKNPVGLSERTWMGADARR